MRTNVSLPSIAIAWCLVFLSSCQQDDTNRPVIDIISPTEDYILHHGHELSIVAELSDDVELSYYKIRIESESGFGYFEDKVSIQGLDHILKYKMDLSDLASSIIVIHLEVVDNQGLKSKKSTHITAE